MNYKRILSLLALLTIIIACSSVAFASSDVNEIDQGDDFDLDDSLYQSDDDLDEYSYIDDDSDLDDSDYDDDELDEDSDEDDWDDDSDYDDDSDDESDDDDDWDDDSDYDDDDEDWDDDSDDDWDDDSDYDDDDDWDDDSDYDDDEDDWDDDYDYDWEDDWDDASYDDVYYEDWSEYGYFQDDNNTFDRINGSLYKYKVYYPAKYNGTDAIMMDYMVYAKAATSGIYKNAYENNQYSNETSDDNVTTEKTSFCSQTTESSHFNDDALLVSSAMPVLSQLVDFKENVINDYNPEKSVSKDIDSSEDVQKNNVVKKVAKTQLNNNYGIIALIVILLICFALGYKKFN